MGPRTIFREQESLQVKLRHEPEGDGAKDLRLVVLCGHQVTLLGRLWQPLAWGALLSSGLGLSLLHLVGMHSVQEVLPALAVIHVLHTHADPLGQDLATNTLVDNNTNGALRDVEDASSLAMVGLVGHTLL